MEAKKGTCVSAWRPRKVRAFQHGGQERYMRFIVAAMMSVSSPLRCKACVCGRVEGAIGEGVARAPIGGERVHLP
eukprot:5433784-Pyramimonas_sp.AAC.1